MNAPIDLLDLLACPRCDQALDATPTGFRCAGCRVDFPHADSLPWLFAEPQAALGEWRGRLHFALQRSERDRERLAAAAARPELRALTRERLVALERATADHTSRLRALLAPFDIDQRNASFETHLALRTRLPPDQGLTTYYANLHRDWAWGDAENAASLDIVAAPLAGVSPRTVLVLGAGAGRLAYDVHMRLGAAATVALDFNPLLFAVAQRAARAEPVALYEFPLAPRSTAEQAVLRTLTAPVAARPGLSWILGDAHRPPFRRSAFDAVITPWLVDILPEPFDVLASRVNALLAPGGRWINFGSLSFHDPDPAARYGIDECTAVLEEQGFGDVAVAEHEIPYLCSPASRHGRRERVVTWSATKTGDGAKPPRHHALPDWIVRGNEPVPLIDSFRSQILATRVHAFIMQLIDGRRSLKDIAKVMTDQRFMTVAEAEPAIRAFLTKMHDDSRRSTTY